MLELLAGVVLVLLFLWLLPVLLPLALLLVVWAIGAVMGFAATDTVWGALGGALCAWFLLAMICDWRSWWY